MFRTQSIALLLAASLAAPCVAAAEALDDAEAGEAVTEPHDGALPHERVRPYPERRYEHRRRRHSHESYGPPPYDVPGVVGGYAPYGGEWNYGQPPREPPPESPRGLHNGLYYY